MFFNSALSSMPSFTASPPASSECRQVTELIYEHPEDDTYCGLKVMNPSPDCGAFLPSWAQRTTISRTSQPRPRNSAS